MLTERKQGLAIFVGAVGIFFATSFWLAEEGLLHFDNLKLLTRLEVMGTLLFLALVVTYSAVSLFRKKS